MEEQGISPLASPLHPPATWHVPGLGLFSPRPGQLPSNQVHGQIRQRIWRQPRPLLGIPNPTGRGRKDESQVFTFPGWLWPRFTLPVLLESGGLRALSAGRGGLLLPRAKVWMGPSKPVAGGPQREAQGSWAGPAPSPGHPDNYRPKALWLKLPSCHSWTWGPWEPWTILSL